VVKSYQLLLEVRDRKRLEAFDRRLKADEQAGTAEAVIFAWLRQLRFDPEWAEDLATGGPDFMCYPEGYPPFLVEVTTISKEAAEKRSGWPDQLDDAVHVFGMITPNLFSSARKKAPQLAGHQAARVLAVCLSHIGASALLGTFAAEWLMTSETKIAVPIGQAAPVKTTLVTDLRKAVFFRPQNGAILPARQSISAILLVALWHNESHFIGLLHPEPEVAFDYHCLPDVPFLRVAWPITADRLETFWVIADPEAAKHHHALVELSDHNLREG